MNYLSLKNLNSGYGDIKVLHNISMHLKKGEIVTLVGANGAGKTTILHTIMGLIKPLSGEVNFNGENITGLKTENIVRKGVVLIPENREVFAELTVLDNLLLGSYIHYSFKEKKNIEKELDNVYDLFPVLEKKGKDMANTLSGGEQQMLSIGRGLMSRPKLLMLDEPSLGLAPMLISDIFKTIVKLKESGVSILLVEQNATAALKIADYGYIIETGLVISQGKALEISGNREVVRAYLGKDSGTFTE